MLVLSDVVFVVEGQKAMAQRRTESQENRRAEEERDSQLCLVTHHEKRFIDEPAW
jgi:hypothetical protein